MKLVGGAVAGATAAITAFGASSVSAGLDFDSAMSQVAATMGDKAHEMVQYNGETVDSMVALRDFAQEMGSTTAFSATQASEGLNYMALAGMDAETAMKTLPSVLNLAAAGGMELGAASDMVTDAMSALGIEAKDATKFVDQMATTASNSNTSVSQLGEAILTVGATAKQLAGGTTELNTVLGILADNGTKGAEGGTRLRNIILALGSPIDKAKEELDALGVSAYDSEGNMKPLNQTIAELNNAMSDFTQEQKNKTLNAIFNKTDLADVNYLLGVDAERWEELGFSVDNSGLSLNDFKKQLTDVGLNFEELEDHLMDIGPSTEEIAKAFYESGGSAEQFAKNLEAVSDGNYDDVLKALGGDLDAIQKAFDETSGSAQAMADTQLDNLAGDITLFKSALEGAQIVVSDGLAPTMREFVQFGTDGLSRLTTAFKEGGLSGAMDEFSKLVTEGLNMLIGMLPQLIEAGSQLLNAIIQGIVDNLPILIDATIQIATTIGQAIIENLPLLIDAGIQILSGLLQGIVDNLDAIIDGAVSIIDMLVTGLIDNLPLLIDGAIQIITKLGNALIENLPMLIDAAVQIVTQLATAIAENADEIIPAIVECVITIVEALIDNIDLLIDAAIEIILALADGLIEALPKLIEKAPEIILKLASAIVRNAPKLIESAFKLITTLGKGLIDNIPELLKKVPEIITGLYNKFLEFKQKMKDIGKNIIGGVKQGILDAWESFKSWLFGKFESVIDGVKGIFGIHSPSTEFAYIGKMCIAGFDNEFEDYDPYESLQDSLSGNPRSIEASLFGSTGNSLGIDYSSMSGMFKDALKGMAVMIDGRTAGMLLAQPVNEALGTFATRRI